MRYLLAVILGLALALPVGAQALPDAAVTASSSDASVIESPDTLFRAEVLRVVDERTVTRPEGGESVQQKLELEILEGPFAGKHVTFDGTVIDTIAKSRYREGDRVVVWWSKDPDGNDVFYVTDYVRDYSLLWMALMFFGVVLVVGRMRGLRALVALALSAASIFFVIIPALLKGWDPLLVTVPVSAVVLALSTLITNGRTRVTASAVLGIAASLALTGFLAYAFSVWAHMSGYGSEEATVLTQLIQTPINMGGLFLAGVIIGTLGVLDDVVISQASLVEELADANPELTRGELFRRAMNVGHDHTAAVVNTLFLAYAGASLPLILLFSIHQAPFLTFRDVVNNEIVASEIVRTLVGSIGLVLTVPITTVIAARFAKR